jgi:hypothetical protein
VNPSSIVSILQKLQYIATSIIRDWYPEMSPDTADLLCKCIKAAGAHTRDAADLNSVPINLAINLLDASTLGDIDSWSTADKVKVLLPFIIKSSISSFSFFTGIVFPWMLKVIFISVVVICVNEFIMSILSTELRIIYFLNEDEMADVIGEMGEMGEIGEIDEKGSFRPRPQDRK